MLENKYKPAVRQFQDTVELINSRRTGTNRYATNANGNVIAQWLDGRWRILHMLAIDCRWYNGGEGLLVNGEPIVKQSDFIEIEAGTFSAP